MRHLLIGSVGLWVAAWTVAPAAAQTIVVTAKPSAELADDLEYLIKMVVPDGDPRVQDVLDAIGSFKKGEMVKGLDHARGFGLAVTLPREFPNGGSPTIVAAVPVTDLGQFLDSVKGLGLAVDDQPGAPGFSHKVSGPDGSPTVYVVQSRGYALFSLIPDGADRLKEMDPASWWKKGRPETALSLKVRVAEIPTALKDQFATQFDAQMDAQRDRKPGEEDTQFRTRIATQDLLGDAIKSLVRDGDTIALDLDLSRKTGELAVEIGMTGRPGTDMAKALHGLESTRSRFERLSRDADLSAWARFPMAKSLRELIGTGFDQGVKEASAKIEGFKTDESRKLFARFMELLKASITAPEMDYGLSIRHAAGTGEKDQTRFLLLGGLGVQDGLAFDRLLRDVIARYQPENGFKVNFDVARATDGTPIHQMILPYDDKDKEDVELVKRFGKAALAFAFRKDALIAAFGENSPKELQKAVEALALPAGAAEKSDGFLALQARVSRLSELADTAGEQAQIRRAAGTAFKGEAAGRDRMTLSVKGEGDGIRLRLAVHVPALGFLATIGSGGPGQ